MPPGVAQGHQRIGFAGRERAQAARTMEESFFFAHRGDRLVIHFHHFGGVDDFDTMVAKTAGRQAAWMSAWLPTECKRR